MTFEEVYKILYKEASPRESLITLMNRPGKSEQDYTWNK